MSDIDRISGDVLDASIQLHRDLGPGLLESVYETVLAGELMRRGYRVSRQHPVDIEFNGLRFEAAFRIDLLVEDRLLINFGGATLKEGFRRLVNDYSPSASLRLCAKPITE